MLVVALGLGLLWPSAPIEATAGELPQTVAEQLDAALLNAMKNAKTLGYGGRYEQLAPVLERSFDFPFMARVAVGRHWREMSEAERTRLVALFGELSIATFASRFNGYGGERFAVIGKEDRPRGAKLVINHLVKSDGEVIPINFLMREVDGGWRIVDVFLDAKYSELAIKRSEYTAVIKREGLDKLIEIMERKIAAFASAEG